MPVLIFQKFWNMVGDEVSKAVLDVLDNNASLEGKNHTLVSYLPKLVEPKDVSQFRPIIICNVLYKMVASCMTNRVKRVLYEIISESQSAFVPVRHNVD